MMFHSKVVSAFFVVVLFSQSIHAQTVAILDTGINKNAYLRVPATKIVGTRCFSENDDSLPGPNGYISYYKVSLCPNGSEMDLSTLSAIHPRVVYQGEPTNGGDRYKLAGVPLTHGNSVSNALHLFNRQIKHKPIQTYGARGSLPLPSLQINCDHGWYFLVGNKDCYSVQDDAGGLNRIYWALKHLVENEINNISAISISTVITDANLTPRLCTRNIAQEYVDALYDRGIAVVAALDNYDYPSGKQSWPNCLRNVINVGGTARQVGIGIGGNGIDFFARGNSEGAGGKAVYGNSFSSPRVAGAFALLHEAKPDASVFRLSNALKQAGSTTYTYKAQKRRYIQSNQIAQAINILTNGTTNPPTPNPEPPTNPDPTQPTTPAGQRATLGITSDTYYANFAKFSFDLNGNAYHASSLPEKSPAKASARITDLRDIKLTFDAQLCTGKDPSTLQGVDIFVNGVRRHYFHGLRHTPSAMDCYNLGYRGLSFMLNRNWLKSGENTIEMHRRNYRDPFTLGATNIRMDYNPPETLRIDQKDPRLYGHRVGTRKHLTGLRVEFASTKDDLEFSATGFDIDSSTEIALFLNYKLIGYLTRGSSSRYNAGDVFRLEKEDFVSSGINTLEFVQTSSSDRENWGVVNMELTGVKPPAITGALMLLLGD
ncbi:MAG: hypothetical protein ACRBHB_13665 [Arenicella sp.]